MQDLIDIIIKKNLIYLNPENLKNLKDHEERYFLSKDTKLYKNSLYKKGNILFFLAQINKKKSLFLVSNARIKSKFKGKINKINGIYIQEAEMNYRNSQILQDIFPFTSPISLRDKITTLGCGDRLGIATPGHIRAVKDYDVYPVFAQQSKRELTLTKRNYEQVCSDVTFSVFQEGFERGYGADGDHLKTLKDIDTALKFGMRMITLDLSDLINSAAANWTENKIEQEFEMIKIKHKERILEEFSEQSFNIGDKIIKFSSLEVKKCTLMYQKALDFAEKVDKFLKKRRKGNFDLEISIDEASTPTLPSHHIYIIKELIYRNISINSLAPKFIGDFQKAIDYIGDTAEFEKNFRVHSDIAKKYGNYKISVHSGSDKFSVYPIIGKNTGMHFHLKTAGTSWLEAIRCIAKYNPELYRKIHKKAFQYYNQALNYYHITADISKIENIDDLKDEQLLNYLENNDSRQLLHITYGGLLNDPEIKDLIFNTLIKNEDSHYNLVAKHLLKHIELLGIKKIIKKQGRD